MIHTANMEARKVIMHVNLRAQNQGSMPFSPRFHFFRWRSKILLTKTRRMLLHARQGVIGLMEEWSKGQWQRRVWNEGSVTDLGRRRAHKRTV